MASVAVITVNGAATAAPGPIGAGFTVTAGDLQFILQQIKISERHANTLTASNPCGTLVGTGPNQIPDVLTSYGLRTVDGSCNNLIATQTKPGAADQTKFGSADQVFPRLTDPVFRDAEPITAALPVGAPGPTSYAQKTGNVVDSQPRVISNLIVDQTSTNPAAVAAAGFPIRTQGNPGQHPCTTDPDPTHWARGHSCRLRADRQDLVHPERHHRRRPVAAVQLAVHVLRPVLRPRRRPDRQERCQRSSSRSRPMTR